MSHSPNCQRFVRVVELFIDARPAQFLTKDEVLVLLQLTDPCPRCAPGPEILSPMTGRLYRIAWDKWRKSQLPAPAQVLEVDFGKR